MICVCPCWRHAIVESCRCDFVCVPAGDMLVESCRWDFVCVPAGDLLVESCRCSVQLTVIHSVNSGQHVHVIEYVQKDVIELFENLESQTPSNAKQLTRLCKVT